MSADQEIYQEQILGLTRRHFFGHAGLSLGSSA